jgi:hypothetical protein
LVAVIRLRDHFGLVSTWYIFVAILGPMLVLMIGMIIAQHRGVLCRPPRKRTGPDFFQRHATTIGIVLVLGYGFVTGGVLGLLVSGIFLLFLGLLLAFIMTAIEGKKHRSKMRGAEGSGAEILGDPLDQFSRRFARNFRIAITELPSSWS